MLTPNFMTQYHMLQATSVMYKPMWSFQVYECWLPGELPLWSVYHWNQALLWDNRKVLFIMARKKQKSQFNFVTVRLDKKEKAAFTDWAEKNGADLWQYWTSLVDSGYKISHKCNLDSGQYYTTLIGTEDATENVGLMLSSVHNNPGDSILLALWKHFILFKGGEWSEDDSDADWG